MLIAKVVGSAVATIKDEKIHGTKLLVVREANVYGEPTGKAMVAIDTVDAGVGDLVLTASGSSARQTNITKDRPVDTVIMAILDSLEVGGEVTFRKS
jgi:microcompartment protein CcmK/EutM